MASPRSVQADAKTPAKVQTCRFISLRFSTAGSSLEGNTRSSRLLECPDPRMLAPRKRRRNRFLLYDCRTSVYRIKCWYQIDGSFGLVEVVEPTLQAGLSSCSSRFNWFFVDGDYMSCLKSHGHVRLNSVSRYRLVVKFAGIPVPF
jgi:hypothetical protein